MLLLPGEEVRLREHALAGEVVGKGDPALLINGRRDNHTGTDIPAPSGTPIYAAQDGVVTTVNRNKNSSSYGYYCIINHGNGYATLYAHQCQVPIVNEGETVRKGQRQARVGGTYTRATKVS